MRLPFATLRCFLVLAVLLGGVAGRSTVASAFWPYLQPGFGPCVVPAALTDALDCPWYEIADAGRYHGVSIYDRSPAPAVEPVDLCDIVRDQRHSAGLALAENINQQNDGILRSSVRAVDEDFVTNAEPEWSMKPNRADFEYAFPMSRCDQYWCDPWYDCPVRADVVRTTETDDWAVEDSDSLCFVAGDEDPLDDPLCAFDCSACRAAVRPIVSLASGWLGSLGEQMLAISRALGQIADEGVTEELVDVPSPEPGGPQDAPSPEDVPLLYLGL